MYTTFNRRFGIIVPQMNLPRLFLPESFLRILLKQQGLAAILSIEW